MPSRALWRRKGWDKYAINVYQDSFSKHSSLVSETEISEWREDTSIFDSECTRLSEMICGHIQCHCRTGCAEQINVAHSKSETSIPEYAAVGGMVAQESWCEHKDVRKSIPIFACEMLVDVLVLSLTPRVGPGLPFTAVAFIDLCNLLTRSFLP